MIVPQISVTARRLHDVNFSGWWQALPYVPMLIALLLIRAEPFPELAYRFLQLICLLSVILMVVLAVLDSEFGDNKYGPNPKQPDGPRIR